MQRFAMMVGIWNPSTLMIADRCTKCTNSMKILVFHRIIIFLSKINSQTRI